MEWIQQLSHWVRMFWTFVAWMGEVYCALVNPHTGGDCMTWWTVYLSSNDHDEFVWLRTDASFSGGGCGGWYNPPTIWEAWRIIINWYINLCSKISLFKWNIKRFMIEIRKIILLYYLWQWTPRRSLEIRIAILPKIDLCLCATLVGHKKIDFRNISSVRPCGRVRQATEDVCCTWFLWNCFAASCVTLLLTNKNKVMLLHLWVLPCWFLVLGVVGWWALANAGNFILIMITGWLEIHVKSSAENGLVWLPLFGVHVMLECLSQFQKCLFVTLHYPAYKWCPVWINK